jgi:spore coat protein U-like protein
MRNPRPEPTGVALAVAVVLVLCARAAAADCSVSFAPMNFGTYDALSSLPLDSVATITYSCTAVVNPVMTLSSGNSTSFNPRKMAQGADALNYNLYLDAARTVVWGDGTAGTSTLSCAQGTNLTANVFGRIFAKQNLPIGSYADSVVATIIF